MMLASPTRAQGTFSPAGDPLGVDALPWGSHLCHFYRTGGDLLDVLIPFFREGIARHEACVWVAAPPVSAGEARAALGAAVADLAERISRGQVVVVGHQEWRARGAGATAVGDAPWAVEAGRAAEGGFRGTRLAGNASWLDHAAPCGCAEHEGRVREAFVAHRVAGLCGYRLDRCGPIDALDAARSHQATLLRRGGRWERIEGPSPQRATEDLHRHALELERRVEERTALLEDALRARDEFLSVAAHELRTPLASLKLYVEILARAAQRGPLDAADASRRLDRARVQCDRLDALLNNLLDLSRIRSGRIALFPEELDLAALAGQAHARFSDELARSGRPFRLDAPAPVLGRWDLLRLEQVFNNLIANAVRHAPGAAVEVSVRARADRALLTVRDEGPGIAAEVLPSLFESYAQATPSRGGIGLGLWIVRRIVEAMGGTVAVESRPGRGTAFTADLPLRAGRGEDPP